MNVEPNFRAPFSLTIIGIRVIRSALRLFLADRHIVSHRVDVVILVGNNVSVGIEKAKRAIAKQTVAVGWIGVAIGEDRALELVFAIAHLLALSDVRNGERIANDSFVEAETFACLHRAF